MKKVFALCLCAIMMLSVIPAMTFTTSAAATGDWSTSRLPHQVDKEDDYTPAAGYYYDAEGFHTVSPNWDNCYPIYSVVANETYNLKNDGFSMKFRVDNFSYLGEDNSAAEWIAITISNNPNHRPGYTVNGWGNGLTLLNHGAGDGNVGTYSCWGNEKDENGENGTFNYLSGAPVGSVATPDDEGREIYTFEVKYENHQYNIMINGVTISSIDQVSENLENLDSDGNFYVNISFMTTAKNAVADMTLLEVNGSTPTGTAQKDPDVNPVVIGEMIDSATVPAGQPALLFDASKSCFSGDPAPDNCLFEPQGDNSYRATPYADSFFMSWGPRNSITYEAADFPVYAMMLKNCTGFEGDLYYMVGENSSLSQTAKVRWYIDDLDCKEYKDVDGNVWNLVVFDFSDDVYEFSGRVNGFRVDFTGLESEVTFDICYMGTFRSIEECMTYGDAYATAAGVGKPAETETETETETTPAESETTPAETETTPAESETTPAETESESSVESTIETETSSEVVTGTATESATATAEEEGCSSVIGAGAAALVLSAMAAAVALKKRG